jgi:hypothetical protein
MYSLQVAAFVHLFKTQKAVAESNTEMKQKLAKTRFIISEKFYAAGKHIRHSLP